MIDYDAIGVGDELIVNTLGGDERNLRVEVVDAYVILLPDKSKANAYLVHRVNSLSARFIVGDGEIVSIVNG